MEGSVITDVDQQALVANVRGMKGWLKFLGIVNIITGALQALTIVGILWAWLPIWLGIVMAQAGSRAGDYATRNDTASLVALTGKLKTYFVISGVVLLISLALGILGMIAGVVLSLAGGLALPAFLEQFNTEDWVN